MSIGERLKRRRLELGMTLNEVAANLSVTMATYQRYETNQIKNLKYKMIIELSKALDTSPAYIMGWDKKEPTSAENAEDELDSMDEEIVNAFRLLTPEYKRIALAQVKAMLEIE